MSMSSVSRAVSGSGWFRDAEQVLPKPSQAAPWATGAEELWKQLAPTDKCEQSILIKETFENTLYTPITSF